MSKRPWNARFAYFVTGWPKEYLHLVTWWHIARFITSVCVSLSALLVVCWAVFGGWNSISLLRNESLQAYSQEKQRSETEQKQAANRISQECAVPLAPAQFVSDCLASGIAAYGRNKDTGVDAQAQVDMAFWAEWTFRASVGGLILSFVGLILLLLSLRQTRQAISTDREVGHAQVRAYIGFELLPATHVLPDIVPKAKFKLINTGQSPARKLRHMSFLAIFEHPLLDWQGSLVMEHPDQKTPALTLRAQGDFDVDVEYDPDQPSFTKEVFDSIANDAPRRLYLVAKAIYEDVFETEHESELTAFLEISYREIEPGKFGGRFDWVLSHVRNDIT